MIGIRADANKIIASGHVMRCITIAKQIVKAGGEVTFFTADKESEALYRDFKAGLEGAEIVILDSDWQDMEGELPLLKKEIHDRNINILLIDSYKVTKHYFSELSEVCRTAYMDDLGKEAYKTDLLINYSGYYEHIGYEELYGKPEQDDKRRTKLLLGLEYAPLREQFYEESETDNACHEDGCVEELIACRRSHIRPDEVGHKPEFSEDSESVASYEVNRVKIQILLTAGGADMYGMLLGTLKELEKTGLIAADNNELVLHVVAGSLVSDIDSIRSFALAHENVILHEKVTDMAGLMRGCDLAVAAAGTMLTECAALKLPVIFYQVADNQKYNVEYWQMTGGMIFAGDVSGTDPKKKEQVLKNICRKISDLSKDASELASMSKALGGITDGRGAQRIAKELISMQDTEDER